MNRTTPKDAMVATELMASWRLVPALACALAFVAGCDRSSPSPPSETRTAPPSEVKPAASAIDAGHAPVVKVEVDEVRIRPDQPTSVHVHWSIPSGTDVNDGAPFRVRWNRSDGLADAPNDVTSTGGSVKDGFRVNVTPMKGAPNPTLGGEINIVVCDSATHVVCVPVKRSLELGFIVAKDAAAEAKVTVPLPEARAN